MVLDFLRKQKYITVQPGQEINGARGAVESVWVKCERCGELIFNRDLERNLKVCPKCGFHFRLSAPERIAQVADEGSFTEMDGGLLPVNPFCLADYDDRLARACRSTGLNEAVVCGECTVEGLPAVLVVMDARFMMASMGTVVGEKITRAAEAALERRKPLIIFSASGGARMQEGMLSLMQLPKTVSAVSKLGQAGILYISVLTDPTTGGVSASFAALGDIIIAEPGALIGFAGPRVIEQTIRQKLPEGFQRAEFLKQHGFIDLIVARPQLKETLALLLDLHLRKEA